MTTLLKQGCYILKRTKQYEIYRIGEELFKFVFKTWKLKKVRKV